MNRSIHTASRPVPGIQWGDYPELDEPEAAFGPRMLRAGLLPDLGGSFGKRVAGVRAHLSGWESLTINAFLAQRGAVQQRLAQEGMTAGAIDLACAYATDAARRVLGLAAYDSQLFATLAMLENRLVEMATGEGKSLAAALAAAVGALAGIPVHVLTSNDYLVQRDAMQFRPFFELLGLNVASVVAGLAPTPRRAAYAQPIVYVTAKELVFDYLRDRLLHGASRPALQRRAQALVDPAGQRPMLRGLCMCIVDEADSILIDEAQMPLILSRQGDGVAQRAFLWQAHALAGQLTEDEDYLHLRAERRVVLTAAGKVRIKDLSTRLQPVWKNHQHREETIVSALSARHVYLRDRDYVVADGEIQIVDAVTGRIAEGRKWSRGLHALIALKEGCQAEPEMETLAQITFQRFFRRYIRFGGMSGTLREARGELRAIYGSKFVSVPLQRPSQRLKWPSRLFVNDEARWRAVVARTRELRQMGRPVLIGCDSVDESQRVSRLLLGAGVEHVVLNANFDREEAEIVAGAGATARVTVATNMAGRGTDIHLDPPALAAGGLHVLCCQHNASRRHDRQLAGRAGRQGEPGSCEMWISLQSDRFSADSLTTTMAVAACRAFARAGQVRLPGWLLDLIVGAEQRLDETRQARQRRELFRHDGELERGMSFLGVRE